MLFVFNFHPTKSYTNFEIPVLQGKYKILFSTDELRFGGFGRIDESMTYPTPVASVDDKSVIRLYIPARSAVVLRKN